jgi:hypothetical protein
MPQKSWEDIDNYKNPFLKTDFKVWDWQNLLGLFRMGNRLLFSRDKGI